MKQLNSRLNEYLKRYPVDQIFSFDITPHLSLVSYEPDEFILKNNSVVSTLQFLVEGKAKYTMFQPNGKAYVNTIEAPGIIGEMELLQAQDCSNEVRAYSKCLCFQVSLHYCREEILSDVAFLRYLCSYLSRSSVDNLTSYAQNQAYPLENRLAKYILLMSNEDVYCQRHTEASRYLGVSYRHLLHTLSGFCQRGILTKSGRNYTISDKQSLLELSSEIL